MTEGDDLDDALRTATEAMTLHLYGMERDDDTIPLPTNPADVKLLEDAAPGAFVTLIHRLGLKPIMDETQNRAVKKTLTIPQWLNYEAEKTGINFSQVLQFAPKEKLSMIKKQS